MLGFMAKKREQIDDLIDAHVWMRRADPTATLCQTNFIMEAVDLSTALHDSNAFSECFVDESIQESINCVATAFVFGTKDFESSVLDALRSAGLSPPDEEFKSSARMDSNASMRDARAALLHIAATKARLAVVLAPFDRRHLGRQVLQALQSVVVRNGIDCAPLSVYFDEEIFPSEKEATRLHGLFDALTGLRIFSKEDSRLRPGIQVADAVAHCFGQIIKEAITGKRKLIDIGGPDTGYAEGTTAPLGWSLLTTLRHALLTRPIVYNGQKFAPGSDPVVLDSLRDDIVTFAQKPILLGWGVQIAPEANNALRQAVENSLGSVWLGCVH
jgi:hypothetical protein